MAGPELSTRLAQFQRKGRELRELLREEMRVPGSLPRQISLSPAGLEFGQSSGETGLQSLGSWHGAGKGPGLLHLLVRPRMEKLRFASVSQVARAKDYKLDLGGRMVPRAEWAALGTQVVKGEVRFGS